MTNGDAGRARADVEYEALANGIASAYYAWVTGESQAARQRASVTFTMVSFIVGALVAAGLFGDLQAQATWVRLLGLGALAAWLATAGLLLHAAVGRVFFADEDKPAEDPVPPAADADAWVPSMLDLATLTTREHGNERRTVRARLQRALWAAAAAMALTLATIAAIVLDKPAPQRLHGGIVLTAAGVSALPPACHARGRRVGGSLDAAALDAAFVAIDLAPCSRGGRRRQIVLRRNAIVAVLPRSAPATRSPQRRARRPGTAGRRRARRTGP